MQARVRGDRQQAPRFELSQRSIEGLAQNEKPGCTSGDTGGRGRLGAERNDVDGAAASNGFIFWRKKLPCRRRRLIPSTGRGATPRSRPRSPRSPAAPV